MVFIAGGYDSSYYLSKAVDIWNSVTKSWETPATLSAARSDITAISNGGLSFFAGGDAAGKFDVVDVYTPDTAQTR